MHWILQENIFFENGWDDLVATLDRFGFEYSVHKVVPFTGELIPAPKEGLSKAICFGSYSMRHAAKKYSWTPGVFDLHDYGFVEQKKHWGANLLNYESVVSKFSEAKFTEDEMFVRPVLDSKSFSGRVFSRDGFTHWQKQVANLGTESTLTSDTKIQLAKVHRIQAEYRYWIVKGQLITKSMYKLGDRVLYKRDVDSRVDDFVRDRVSEWSPHYAFVVDVCDTDSGLKVIEINTLNSSGFYNGDVQKLVLALQDGFS